MSGPVVIAGHSHVGIFQFLSTAVATEPGLLPLPLPRDNVWGFCTTKGAYDPSYWDELAAVAPGRTVVVFWLGSQHLAEFLFEQAEPFDFTLASKPRLPLDPSAQLVPESVVREYQSSFLNQLDTVLDSLLLQPNCRVLLAATPPPKGDDAALRDLMMAEVFFQEKARLDGLDLSQVKFTNPHVRLKLWIVIQELMAEIAARKDVPFITVPDGSQDADGFLLRQFWDNDIGHANANYGQLFFQKIERYIE